MAEKLNNKKNSADARPTMNKDSAEAQEPYSGLKCALDRTLYLDEVPKTIRNVNQLIIRVNDEQELLDAACRELVQGRHYQMDWIGYTQTGFINIRPVAHHGAGNGGQFEYDQGTSSAAIRTGKPVVIQDILNNPDFGPCREHTLKKGYRAAAAFPLISTVL